MGRKSGKNGSLRNTSEIETNNFSCRGSELGTHRGNKQQNTYVAKGLSVFMLHQYRTIALACRVAAGRVQHVVRKAGGADRCIWTYARGVSLSG